MALGTFLGFLSEDGILWCIIISMCKFTCYDHFPHSIVLDMLSFVLSLDATPLKEDYVEGPRPITITVNAQTGDQFCIDISSFILDDNILESTESFSIFLVTVLPCGNVDSSVTVVEILDNDSKRQRVGYLQ